MIEPSRRAVDRIDKSLPQDLQELMKKYCLDDETDAEKRGVVNEHARVLEEIKRVVYSNMTPSLFPTFMASIGQTGSGKSNLSAMLLKANPDTVKIDSDEYKAFREDSPEIQRLYQARYAYLTGPDAYRHRDEMITDAMKRRYNILLEIAPSKKEGLFIDIDEIMNNGYNVRLDTLAVSRLNSLMSAHERYEDQLRSGYIAAKLTSIARHDDSFYSLDKCILEAYNKGVSVNIYERGVGVPYLPLCVFSSENSSIGNYSNPLEALYSVRMKDERKTLESFEKRYNILESQMEFRNAPIEQIEQLKEIRKIYESIREREER